MLCPVKLSRAGWPHNVVRRFPSSFDARCVCRPGDISDDDFTSAVSVFRFGKTFKTTKKARFLQTVEKLSEHVEGVFPTVLDVGASDGTTSLDTIKIIPFSKYFVTDLNTEVVFLERGDRTWFYDSNGSPILMCSERFVVYPDDGEAIFPVGYIARYIFASAPRLAAKGNVVKLVRKELLGKEKEGIYVLEYDVLKPWAGGKVDLIVAANILNKCYFRDDQLRCAVSNLKNALRGDGLMAIVDSRDTENSSIFNLNSGVATLVDRINRGSEIEEIALVTLNEK